MDLTAPDIPLPQRVIRRFGQVHPTSRAKTGGIIRRCQWHLPSRPTDDEGHHHLLKSHIYFSQHIGVMARVWLCAALREQLHLIKPPLLCLNDKGACIRSCCAHEMRYKTHGVYVCVWGGGWLIRAVLATHENHNIHLDKTWENL